MKLFLYSAFCFFLLLISCKESIQEVRELNNGVLYKNYYLDNDSLIQGTLKMYFEDGKQVFEEANYKDGKLNGFRTLYYDSGQPEIIEQYKNDLLQDTLKVYYPSGQIKQKVPYIDGVLSGVLIGYYENGPVKEKVTFNNNLENGPFVEYFENGNIQWQGTYLNGDNEYGELLKHDSSGTLIRKLMCDSIAICHTIWTLNEGDVL